MAHDHGRFVWHELISEDHEAAKGFYGELFGWKFENMDMGETQYPLIKVGEQSIGGIANPPAEGVSPHWVGYLSVEDVDAAAKAIVGKGGAALMDAYEVPTVGRMQPVKDPQGAAFFLFNASDGDPEPRSGAGQWHWDELWASDPSTAVATYRELFGYESDKMAMPNGDYFILKQGEAMRGGVMAAPEGAPPHWAYYVHVDDVDAVWGRVEQLGGKRIGELMDVEGVGRFGFIEDREGGTVGAITPASRG